MSWEYKTLDQLGEVSRGRSKHRPRNDPSLFSGKYPFIQTADVKAANFYITEYDATYNEKGLAQSKLWHPGTLCITIAANIADTGILAMDACFPDSVMGFLPYEGIADVRFVKYCFDILQQNCKKISQGAAQDNLSWEKLSTILFPVPPIAVQTKIADILSTYDNLIENNQKQIKLLEEAAQRLYKEWFVDLRFPGHETTPIVNGVPKGWRVDRADSFFDMSIGKTPPRAEKQWFTDGATGTPWVSISDMGSSGVYVFQTSEGLTEDAISKHNIKVVPADTVLLSFKLTVGRVSITADNSCTNEAIAHFVIKDSTLREYVYLYLKCFGYDSLGNTSSISKAVNSKIVKGMQFIMPDRTVLSQFHQVLRPIFDEIKNHQKANIYLAEARDRLLPKLMNGEIEV